ncbi:hypothetical protein KI616_15275 [Hydrogenophaga taeniospiralis]|nr:hypothetical protein KI616_15275 [Hydrogenophaga taeniospiralis]
MALAALQATQAGADPMLLVLTADHLIQNSGAFCAAVCTALPLAKAGGIWHCAGGSRDRLWLHTPVHAGGGRWLWGGRFC